MIETKRQKIFRLMTTDRVMDLLMIFMFAERIATMFYLGLDYFGSGDCEGYFFSGLRFANTGMITMRRVYPSAQIMPGMPVLIGILSYIFGQGEFLKYIGMRLVWYVMGVATAWFVYKAVSVKAPGWYGILAALAFFAPNRAWSNNVTMTETPYSLFLYMSVYYGLLLGGERNKKALIGFVISFFLAFMFRANILILLPPFLLYWLLLEKQKPRLVLKNMAVLIGALMLFIVPWTVRNYIYYDAFIPISYGAGNPNLLGTYQGEGYPEDDELDYETNVDAVVREKFAKYYDEDGNIKNPVCEEYLILETDAVKASYRLKAWAKKDLGSLLKSYLIIKPRLMLNWVWCWDEIFGIDNEVFHRLAQINMVLTALAAIPSIWNRRTRSLSLFLLITYVFAVYVHSLSFVTDRYAYNIFPMRYMVIALGIYAAADLWKSRKALSKTAK